MSDDGTWLDYVGPPEWQAGGGSDIVDHHNVDVTLIKENAVEKMFKNMNKNIGNLVKNIETKVKPNEITLKQLDKTTTRENALIAASNVGVSVVYGVKSIPSFMIGFVKFLWAMIIIAVLLFVLYIVFYLIYYYHPQFFFICHWTGFHTYMSRFYTDFKSNVAQLADVNRTLNLSRSGVHGAWKKIAGYDLATELAPIKSILNQVGSLTDDELTHIFRFWNSLKNIKGTLEKMDLGLIGDDKYLEDGEVNPEHTNIKDLAAKAEAIRKLRNEVAKLKTTIDQKEMANMASGIVGSLDPVKLYWMKLIINGTTSNDETLQRIHETLNGVDPNQNLWAIHIKQDSPCDKRPLTSNERIYMEIKRFLSKCNANDKNNVKAFIDSVLIENSNSPPTLKPEAYADTRAIFDAIMAVYELDLMLNYYLYDIRLGYETRKSGYRLNFVIWTYYWWPYAQWLFVIKIGKQTWEKFPRNFKNSVLSFLEWWVSLPEALARLPLTLAGEGFQQHKDSNYPIFNYLNNIVEPFFIPKHIATQLKPDTVEHFGFLKGLLSIGLFFMAILDVAMAMVFMITQPIKFLMMLIGFVVALGLMVVYILITVIGLHYVFAGIWAVITVLCAAVFFT